jgi:hypothetical protein
VAVALEPEVDVPHGAALTVASRPALHHPSLGRTGFPRPLRGRPGDRAVTGG